MKSGGRSEDLWGADRLMKQGACDDAFLCESFAEIANVAPVSLWRIDSSFKNEWANHHWV
jgi:hypothetical protein